MSLECASSGHHRHSRKLPAMDMAEAFDAVFFVAVACVPIGVDGVVGTEVDHAKRAGGGVEKKPPGVGRVKQRIDEVYGGFGGVLCRNQRGLKHKGAQSQKIKNDRLMFIHGIEFVWGDKK